MIGKFKDIGNKDPFTFLEAPKVGDYNNMPDCYFFDPLNQLGIDISCPDCNNLLSDANFWTDFGHQKMIAAGPENF